MNVLPFRKTSKEITHVKNIIGPWVRVERFTPIMVYPNQTSAENNWQRI
jgi:hypothetical protein